MNFRYSIILILCAIAISRLNAQDTIAIVPAQYKLSDLNYITGLQADSLLHQISFYSDSLLIPGLPEITLSLQPSFRQKPIVVVTDGYVSYNWNFRTTTDTPFIENNISEHLINGQLNITIAQQVPFRISYLERESNSSIYKNFKDIRIDFDLPAFYQIITRRVQHSLTSFLDSYTHSKEYNLHENQINRFDQWLENPAILRELIISKEIVLNAEWYKKSMPSDDSLVRKAKGFIGYYDKIEELKKQYLQHYDSLQQNIDNQLKRVTALKDLLYKNASITELLNNSLFLQICEKDERVRKWAKLASGIRKFSVGSTMPQFSRLTIGNVNVKGIYYEYIHDRFYHALTAGLVDFRSKDYLYKKPIHSPQYIYSGRVGYGHMDGNIIILTAFGGRKQFPAFLAPVYGLSIEAQTYITQYCRLKIELAQSSPVYTSVPYEAIKRSNFHIGDKNSGACSIQIQSGIPQLRTELRGNYQFIGPGYQGFTLERGQGSLTGWNIQAKQPFLKRTLHLIASLQKNDFTDPFILQRYKSNTVYKSLSVSFNKRKWPAVTFAFAPISQLTLIDRVVYENHFQSLSGTIQHFYPIGDSKGITILSCNRFYNNVSDTGFIYYNTSNIFINQTIQFSTHTTDLSFSSSTNHGYSLYVIKAGIQTTIAQKHKIGLGIEINKLNKEASQCGFYGNAQFTVPLIGQLNISIDKHYLPGTNHQLIKNEMYTICFIRRFKSN